LKIRRVWPELAVSVLLFVVYTRISDLREPSGSLFTLNQLVVACFSVAMLIQRLIVRRDGLIRERAMSGRLIYGAAIGL